MKQVILFLFFLFLARIATATIFPPDSLPCKVTNISFFANGFTYTQANWTKTSGDSNYTFEYKLLNDTTNIWTQIATTNNNNYATIANLDQSKKYAARVRHNCEFTIDTSAIFIYSWLTTCFLPSIAFNSISDSVVKLSVSNSLDSFYKSTVSVGSPSGNYSKTITLTDSHYVYLTDFPKCDTLYASGYSFSGYFKLPSQGPPATFKTSGCTSCQKINSFGYGSPEDAFPLFFISWCGTEPNNFIIQYKLASDLASNVWVKDSAVGTSYNARNLKFGENYLFRVIQSCYGKLDTSFTYHFSTYFPIVSNLTARTSSDTTLISWSQYDTTVFGKSTFEIQYKLASDSLWSGILNSSTNNLMLRGLAYCGSYNVRVRAVCYTAYARDWTYSTFKAGNHCFGIGNKNTLLDKFISNIQISPNPGSTSPTIEFQLMHESNVSIRFFDAVGREVFNQRIDNIGLGFFSQSFENLANLSAGLYFISLQTDDDAPITIRWVKL